MELTQGLEGPFGVRRSEGRLWVATGRAESKAGGCQLCSLIDAHATVLIKLKQPHTEPCLGPGVGLLIRFPRLPGLPGFGGFRDSMAFKCSRSESEMHTAIENTTLLLFCFDKNGAFIRALNDFVVEHL